MLTTAVEVIASPEITSALTRLGRTEEVRFSRTGRRVAIAGFERDVVYVVDIEVSTDERDDLMVTITGLTEASSSGLHQPHGICFLDEHTLVVANRLAEVPILRIPPAVPGIRRINLEPMQTLRADEVHGLKSPGSVVASRLGADLHEIMVCNGYADNISRHVIDARHGYTVLSSEVLVRCGLELPDGVAISEDRCWLAVSNHNTHGVLLFRYDESLGPDTQPIGLLENINYPHGVCFSRDGAYVVVADAGAPYVHAFARGRDDWRGSRQPIATTRIMDDDTYLSGRFNPQEGGPKGLDLDRSMRLVVVSSEQQSLAFFDARQLVPGIDTTRQMVDDDASADEATRSALIRTLSASTQLDGVADALQGALADRDSLVVDLEATVADLGVRLAELELLIADRDERAAELERAVRAGDARRVAMEEGAIELERRLNAALDAVGAEREDARAAEDYQRHVVADLQLQLDALHASTSWRITAIPRSILASMLRTHSTP